jgi:hypothetical protein
MGGCAEDIFVVGKYDDVCTVVSYSYLNSSEVISLWNV